ncbi:alpha/beta hydrolase [Actinoplanes sp. OR16]|uniref:alpha/beta hydrolase family protein n=1 Tax=Actinoplanes sp. OR16 TaxID=946334 RepID=UPI000F6BE1A1|nr:alpha/beta fold hydrolase [Actinoplanes sp. OR16]BBH71462.1 alpha/beta hydrolase [Actinoplanes sp. OR16]
MRNNEVRVGRIGATLHEPDDEPAAALVIHPATATPSRFYANFAAYLADNGIATVTYDYRGTGRSGSPRANRSLGMRDWITEDVPAVTAWTAARFPGLPQLAIGHSVGGHALALGYGGPGLSGLVILASHAASARAVPDPAERRRVRLLLHVVGPALGSVLGYVPARRLGLGEDIPAAAMRQWGGWAKLDGYFFDDPAMDAAARAATVTQPVLAVGFTDDKWATPASIDRLTSHLTAAPVERRTYSPADGGVDAIGHHGFLRRGVRDTLWPELLTWLQKQSSMTDSR